MMRAVEVLLHQADHRPYGSNSGNQTMDATTTEAPAMATTAAERRFVLIAAILASSMGFIDGSVISIAIPAIRADLGATLADAQWISNGYLLFLSSLILLGGAAGDRFGLRKMFGLGIV